MSTVFKCFAKEVFDTLKVVSILVNFFTFFNFNAMVYVSSFASVVPGKKSYSMCQGENISLGLF